MENKLNCPNCGAPRTDTICEYCGTVFYNINHIEAEQSEINKIKAEIKAEINRL